MKNAQGFITAYTLTICAALFCTSNALAVEFKNIANNPAIMFDAPTARGQKIFIAPQGMPLEVVFVSGAWTKVRDFAGDLSWVETKQLTAPKNILIRTLNAKIRTNNDENAEVVFSADKGVLLEVIDSTTTGWLKVKHRDGGIGFIKLADVWGA